MYSNCKCTCLSRALGLLPGFADNTTRVLVFSRSRLRHVRGLEILSSHGAVLVDAHLELLEGEEAVRVSMPASLCTRYSVLT